MNEPGRKKILICDDEEGIRESFKLILADDYELDFVATGPEAIDRLKASNPDAMILDIKMPKMHGFDVLKKIKSIKPKLPVIIVTGYQSVEMAQEATRLGAADYIPKPFETAQIRRAVNNSLG